jgi:orotidine-5'-phosphate decarboxylase
MSSADTTSTDLTSTGLEATPRARGFRAKYEAAATRNDSLLCIGLDPDPRLMPPGADIVEFLRAVIDATADLVCCYKPNAAFFEVHGAAGWEALRAVIEAVPDDVPVILDAKRGDVGNTSQFYARTAFEALGADAITANPYLGGDGLEPFLAYEDRHTFALCRTSNAGARDLQDVRLEDGRPLYEQVALLANGWNTRGNLGLVVGATYPAEAARIRELCPELLFLVPGIGAQQGDVDAAVRASIDARGGGILVSASRGVLYASKGGDFAAAARAEADRLRQAINAARG